MANITPMALMSQPINHTVPVDWKLSEGDDDAGVPLYRVLHAFNLDIPREGVATFVMALKTDRYSMVPHLSQISKHWCPMDAKLEPDCRYHLLFGDVRQYAEATRYCGDNPILLCPPGTPQHQIGSSHINCQYMAPTDMIFALSAAGEELTNLNTDVAVLKTQVRRLQAQLVAIHELLASHHMEVPKAKARTGLAAHHLEVPKAKAKTGPHP